MLECRHWGECNYLTPPISAYWIHTAQIPEAVPEYQCQKSYLIPLIQTQSGGCASQNSQYAQLPVASYITKGKNKNNHQVLKRTQQ